MEEPLNSVQLLSNLWGPLQLIGVASLCVQYLLASPLSGSALLYVSIPYTLALIIAAVRPYAPNTKWYHKYLGFLTDTLIVFLASSLVLREGFICVLLFLPILFIGTALAFLTEWLSDHRSRRVKHLGLALPLIVLVSGLEGTHQTLSFDREETVKISATSTLPVEHLRRNLTLPIDLRRERNWLLAVFPMPYEIDSGAFHIGAIHTAKTRYHRWFVNNTHEGEVRLQITQLSDHHLQTRIVHDTSYFSNYLTLKGSAIHLSPLPAGGTRIDLTIEYRRKLDPAWYFAPIQRYAIEHTAQLLIQEVVIRGQVSKSSYRS